MNTKWLLSRMGSHPAWIFRKAYLWSRSILRLRKNDVVLAFYPKTGSTWVRILFYNLFTGQLGQSEKFRFDDVNAALPEFGHPSFFNEWMFKKYPRLVKTHRPYLPVYFRNRRILFIREPRDTMVSFLHYANARKDMDSSENLWELVHHPDYGLQSYFQFYHSWIPKADLIVKYEDLRKDTYREFKRIIDFIGIDANEEAIRKAIEESDLRKTRKAQEISSEQFKGKFSEGFVFARKGAVGEGKEQFTGELESYLEALKNKYKFTVY